MSETKQHLTVIENGTTINTTFSNMAQFIAEDLQIKPEDIISYETPNGQLLTKATLRIGSVSIERQKELEAQGFIFV